LDNDAHDGLADENPFFSPSEEPATRQIDFRDRGISDQTITSSQKLLCDVGNAVCFQIGMDGTRPQSGGELGYFWEKQAALRIIQLH